MKKYGGARTMKKKSLLNKKKPHGISFKNVKSKEKKLQKNIIRLLERKNNNDYSYIKVLEKFKMFFKGVLKMEEKIAFLNDANAMSNFDMKKLEISDKLEQIDSKHGKLLSRIRKYSSDIYMKIKKDNNNNVNMNVDNEIIELYANVIEELLDMDEEYENSSNTEFLSELTMVSSILADELTKEFLEVKKDTKAVEDELVDIFKGFAINKKNNTNASVENNISKILLNLKL